LGVDSSESVSETESEGGSDYTKTAWWAPKKVGRGERRTRACSTVMTSDRPTLDDHSRSGSGPGSERNIPSYIASPRDISPHRPDSNTTTVASPILGRGPRGQNRHLLQLEKRQSTVPSGTVSGVNTSRTVRPGSGRTLPCPGTMIVKTKVILLRQATI